MAATRSLGEYRARIAARMAALQREEQPLSKRRRWQIAQQEWIELRRLEKRAERAAKRDT